MWGLTSDYKGLFKYNSSNIQYEYTNTQLNTIAEDVYNTSFYNGNGVFRGTLQNVSNLSMNDVKKRVNLYSDLSYLQLNNNITNMMYCYSGYSTLINIPNFDTSNVINMSGMFNGCTNLINIPNLDTSNVTSMISMFAHCTNLTNVPNFNTSNVTNMAYMFRGCNNLSNVPNFNTSNVTNMTYMFYDCHSLTNVPEFNTSNVTNMAYMFQYCNNLSNASIQNIINMCLNSNITDSTSMNLNNINTYSPLRYTKFDSTYYQNRWSELTNAGWTY